MEKQNFYTHFELSMPKDGAGNVSPTKIAQLDDAYGLKNLLIQSSLLAYASFATPPYPRVPCDLDTSRGVYYEQSVSFLNLIQKEYLKEAKRLSIPSNTLNVSMDETLLFTMGSASVLLKRSAIIRVAKMLLLGTRGETGVSPDDIKVFDLFVFPNQEIKEFFRSIAVHIYNQNIPASGKIVYESIITLPVLHRHGYDVYFDFLTSPESPIIFRIDNEDDFRLNVSNRYFNYFLNITFKNNNSDIYLGYLYKTRLSTLLSETPTNKLYYFLERAFGGSNHTSLTSRLEFSLSIDPEKTNTFCNCMVSAGIIVQFLCKINEKFGLIVGPLTTYLFKAVQNVENQNNLNPQLSRSIGKLLGADFAPTQSDTTDVSTSSESANLFFREIKPCSFDIEALKEKEPEEFDIYPEEDFEEDEDQERDEEVEETESDENSEDVDNDESDETSDGIEKKPTVRVKVAKNSILLKVRDTDKSDLNTWLYLIEIANIIKAVLDNPPGDMAEDDRVLLHRLLYEWLFLLDVNSVDSFVRSVINIVPKPN